MTRGMALGLLLSLASCGGASSAPVSEPREETHFDVPTGDVAAALAGVHRTDAERARDRYRHPEETLAFFGLEPAMTVVEIWPGGGWYTSVLAPVLRDHGRLVAATLDPEDETFRGRFGRDFRERLAAHPEVYDQVEPVVLYPGNFMDDVPDGSVDMVLSFRSAHNWIRWGGEGAPPYLAAIARVLRPGGVFGIVQHRAPPGTEHGEDGTIGYLTEERVIALATAAGLELAERSEINANADDTHEHPSGVWSLPPTLRGPDRDAHHAIGESDRMTLRFIKPAP